MQVASIELSTDSLIVATALAGVVPPRHMIALSFIFGLFDGLASLVGPMLHVQIPGFGLLPSILLILWVVLIVLNAPAIGLLSGSLGWAYALPPIVALDNLVVPDSDWALAGLVSAGMALVGFAAGSLIFRNRFALRIDHRWLGLPLAISGALLLAS
jgi:hypothetical protein